MKKLLFILGLVLSTYAQAQFGLQFDQRTKVLAVHDGDSYKVEKVTYYLDTLTHFIVTDTSKMWVRIMGVDCPEVVSNYVTANQPFGVMIGDSIRNFLKGKTITLELNGVDIYHRPLAVIQVDSVDLASYILLRGWGWYMTSSLDRATRKTYQKYRDYAKKSNVGIWASKESIEPRKWRKEHTPKLNLK